MDRKSMRVLRKRDVMRKKGQKLWGHFNCKGETDEVNRKYLISPLLLLQYSQSCD